MSEKLRESLSAAMDGEADAFELRRVFDEAKHDQDLREQWHRFHLMRDVLRQDLENYDREFKGRVWSSLLKGAPASEQDAERVLTLASRIEAPLRGSWWPRMLVAGFAIILAAGVFFTTGLLGIDPEGSADQMTMASSGATDVDEVLSQGAAVTEPVLYSNATAIDRQRHNALMLHHIQQRAMNQSGVVSFTKMAAFSDGLRAQPAGLAIDPMALRAP